MNIRILPLTILLLGSGSAYASDVPNAREMFRRLDSNGDRAIQFFEIQATRAALFDRLDANGDGFLDSEEVRATAQRVGNRRNVSIVSAADRAELALRIDSDADGRIRRQEFSRFIPDRVRRADANGDGVLSLRELRALRRQ